MNFLILDLPREIIYIIFKYLSGYDLAFLKMVNTKFMYIVVRYCTLNQIFFLELDRTSKFNHNALLEAIVRNSYSQLNLLISLKYKYDTVKISKINPGIAKSQINISTCEHLYKNPKINHLAKIDKYNQGIELCLVAACMYASKDIIKQIYSLGCIRNEGIINYAVQYAPYEHIRFIIRKRFPISEDIIVHAINRGNYKIVKLVYEYNCPIGGRAFEKSLLNCSNKKIIDWALKNRDVKDSMDSKT
jgi:hypothetical protein